MSDIFKKSPVEMLVLHMLSKEDAHGYQLAQWIKERSKGLLSVQITSLYPVLYRLEEDGYITGVQIAVENPDSPRKRSSRVRIVYNITPSGKKHLDKLRTEYEDHIQGYMNILASQDNNRKP